MRIFILLLTLIGSLIFSIDCDSKSYGRNLKKSNSIIQFQDSIIKNSVTYSYVYGDYDIVAEKRGLSLRAAVAWLRDCRKDERPVIALNAEWQGYRVLISPDAPKEENIKVIEKSEEYINQYPFKYYSPDQEEILKDLLSKNQIVIKYRSGLPKFNTLVIKLKVYIPGEEIVRLFTYSYRLYYQNEESPDYISVRDAILDYDNKDEISSLRYDTKFILDEIEYKEYSKEEDSKHDFWGYAWSSKI